MVFDPLSVIGYVGTAAGLIGFCASAVARLEKVGRDFRECGEQLRWYNTRFASCGLILKGWAHLWCDGGRAFSDQDYEYFWGAEHFYQMREKIDLIKFEIDAIGLLLYSGLETDSNNIQEPTAEDWRRWQKRIDSLSTPGRLFNVSHNWISKLCFATIRGANLEERTNRLKSKIDDLIEFSKLAYWDVQGRISDPQPVTGQELEKLLDRKRWIDELSWSLTQLYQECYRVGATWSLVLSAPDEEAGLSSFDDQTDILIEFDVFKKSQIGFELSPKGILPLHYSGLREVKICDFVEKVHLATSLAMPTRYTATLKNILLQGDEEFVRIIRNSGLDPRITHTTMAIRLVNWTILLWNTPWTSGVCTCRIRYVFLDLEGERWNATFTAMPGTLIGEPCHDPALASRKALLLGASLAELAIKKKVTARLDTNGCHVLFVNDTRILEKDLLELVKHNCGNNFKSVVGYCLYFDLKVASIGLVLRPSDVIGFKENVIELLEKNYLRTLKEHVNTRKL